MLKGLPRFDLLRVVLLAVVLSFLVDPYLGVSSRLVALAINAVLVLLIAALVFALSGRRYLSLAVTVLLLLVLRYVDSMKMEILHSNVTFADVKLLPSLLRNPDLVLGFVRLDAVGWVLLGGALIATVVLLVWSFRRHGAGIGSRLLALALFAVGTAVAATYRVPMEVTSADWMLAMQMQGAQKVGIAGNILLGYMASSQVRPDALPEKAEQFWANARVISAQEQSLRDGASPSAQPDIVFVQSESLFEPSILCGMPDAPFLTNLAAAGGGSMENLQVPVFGHLTLQTEFEMMSGFPVRFAPNSLMAYYELVDGPVNAIPRHLVDQGYRTIAIHPSLRTFWRRQIAIPVLGFDTFIDGGAYFRPTDFSPASWVNDRVLTESVLSDLRQTRKPTMLFAISIENHGPWGTTPIRDTRPVPLPDTLHGDARQELHDYLVRARHADEAFGRLRSALQQRKRPTMVVIYGDHLPALSQTYGQLCFKDARSPEAHLPPWRIWANYPLKEKIDGRLPSYLLGAAALHAAGIDLRPTPHLWAAYLTAKIQIDPSASQADKDAVRALYDHVAALGVFESPLTVEMDARYVVGDERALDRMLAMQAVPASVTKAARKGEVEGWRQGFRMPASSGNVTQVEFALHGRVAAAVLRPWADFSNDMCLGLAAAAQPMLSIVVDGQERKRYRLDGRSIALDTLPLSGAQSLRFMLDTPQAAGKCANVAVAVSQLQCYSSFCDVAGTSARFDVADAVAQAPEPAPTDATDIVPGALQTDLDRARFMLSRMLSHEAPYTPMRITPDGKLFLHPTTEKPASADFDVTGLARADLVVAIQPLDANCRTIATAGVVGVTVALDGKPVASQRVDRDTPASISVDTRAGRTLTVRIDVGNEVAWCDWSAVGFSTVRVAEAASH